jgi:hypothetical protein
VRVQSLLTFGKQVSSRSARMRRQSRPSKCCCGTGCKGCPACVAKRACNRPDECNPHVMILPYERSPYIVVSMICNPNWLEIQTQMPADAHWTNCMDIVTRVFAQKFDALVDVIVGQRIFGPVLGHVHQIELLPKTLPRADMVIVLGSTPLTPQLIDAIVCAEVPNPTTQPELHNVVSKFMLHKPCDSAPNARCRQYMDNGSCVQRFPQKKTEHTTIQGNVYPQYQRRCRYAVLHGDRTITDDWVIPYNPGLLLQFDCPMHVEVAVRSHSCRRALEYVSTVRFRATNTMVYCSGACSLCRRHTETPNN